VTPSLSASGARKARVLPTSLLVVLPNNLLVGRNNLTLVTLIILRYQIRPGSLGASSYQARPCPFPLLYFCRTTSMSNGFAVARLPSEVLQTPLLYGLR
jgi:hypothetical protein